MFPRTVTLFSLLTAGSAQLAGTPDSHPPLTTKQCTKSGCVQKTSSIVIDANWRWIHNKDMKNCYTGQLWDTTICSDPKTCASACALGGADYAKTYGITTTGDSITMSFITGDNIGSRVYLLASNSSYEMIKLANKEFSFDTDVSKLDCGLNAAVYFSQMDADGGMSKYPGNKAGAAYGTGYCDAQCPQDPKFINGEANVLNWTASPNDKNTGTGQMGSCCAELDIWEANRVSTAYTPHPCSVTEQTRCESLADCGVTDRYTSVCDRDGCDFNSYRMGNTSFYGQGSNFTVDSSKKMTVITQFIGDPITEIRRKYIQGGKEIANSAAANVKGLNGTGDSITDDFCKAQKATFGDPDQFSAKGGMAQMSKAASAGMVLSLSIWDDHTAGMYWLDSTYPPTKPVDTPGVARGSCSTTSGEAKTVEASQGSAKVTYSNIRWGDLDTTQL